MSEQNFTVTSSRMTAIELVSAYPELFDLAIKERDIKKTAKIRTELPSGYNFKQPGVGDGYINLQASVTELQKWMHERDEEAIIEHFAKVNMPGLLRMKDCINKAIEKVSKEKTSQYETRIENIIQP